MKRRTFIKRTALVSVPLMINGSAVAALAKTTLSPPFYDQSDKVLVLIQMDGGNDGLNTLIPLDQYQNLYNARPNIIIPENKILKIEDSLGFHPSMTGMRDLYNEGQLKVIQNVGYPSPNRSHFRSTDIWTSASPSNENWTTGWIGRYFDSLYPGYPTDYPNENLPDPFAITIASRVSETCQGISSNFSMAVVDPNSLTQLDEGAIGDVPETPYGDELTFLRNSIAQTNAYGEVITTAAGLGNNLSTLYSADNKLAQQLKTVALLISGGLKTGIYIVRIGGYDTHANQVDGNDVSQGKHAGLLRELSDAISAFQDDLNLLGLEKRVLGMSFTEFGRQIKSNESLGTDHGEGGPMFLFGNCVNPLILGPNPQISADVKKQDAIPFEIDFRNIYGSILMEWFDLSEESVQELIFPEFEKIDLLLDCSTTSSKNTSLDKLYLSNTPNPFGNSTRIDFKTKGGPVKISILNSLGQTIDVVLNKKMRPGSHSIQWNTSNMPIGAFICQIMSSEGRKSIKLIKN